MLGRVREELSPAFLQFNDVLLHSADFCTEKIDSSAGFRGLVLGIWRQGLDLRDLVGGAVDFSHHSNHHFLYVLPPTGRG